MINDIILSQTHRTYGSFQGISSNFDKNTLLASLKVLRANNLVSFAEHESSPLKAAVKMPICRDVQN